jgi:hypothetical protein
MSYFLTCSTVESNSKWKHGFSLQMKINAGMSFLEIEDLKSISVMHRRLKIFYFLKSKHKRSRISSAIG